MDAAARDSADISMSKVEACDENLIQTETKIFDHQALLERVDGDQELMVVMLQYSLQELPKTIASLTSALERGDAEELVMQAHTIKGSAGNISAVAVAACAANIEVLGAQGQLSAANKLLKVLEKEYE